MLYLQQKKIQDYHRFKPRHGTCIKFGHDPPSSMSVTKMDYAGQSIPEEVTTANN